MSEADADDDYPIIISFDAECSGGNLETHAMVELGAAAVKFSDKVVISLGEWGSVMSVPDGRGWDADCVDNFWNTTPALKAKKEVVEKTPISPVTAMSQFVAWVEFIVKHCAGGDSSRVRFVTDNSAFDSAWVGLYLSKFADHEPLPTFFGKFQAVIDTSSYHQGLARIDHVEERKRKRGTGHFSEDKACREALKVPDDIVSVVPHDHNPVHDAQNIAAEHGIILRFMKCRVAMEKK